ncbi:MAG: hypothetical protein ACTHZ9_02255 [Leucobacter sp.]
MAIEQHEQQLVVFTPAERVELARRTHRSVKRTLGITFVLLAAVILIAGVYLSQSGQASFWGVIGVAAVFLAVPFAMAATISKTERDAERFLAADESTQFVVGPSSLVVGDTVVPYERITCMYANAESEQYSSGGIRRRGHGVPHGIERESADGRACGGRRHWYGAAAKNVSRRREERDFADNWDRPEIDDCGPGWNGQSAQDASETW